MTALIVPMLLLAVLVPRATAANRRFQKCEGGSSAGLFELRALGVDCSRAEVVAERYRDFVVDSSQYLEGGNPGGKRVNGFRCSFRPQGRKIACRRHGAIVIGEINGD